MDTTSVTTTAREVGRPQHFPSCDAEAIGRRVLGLVKQYPEGGAFTLGVLTSFLDSYRGECRCFDIQLRAVEADLAARRKAQRAGHDRSAEIAQLLVARDALRQAVAR